MTESEWLACCAPRAMLGYLWDKASDRKLRLFAVACCRCSRQLCLNEGHRAALELSTRFADGQVTAEELASGHRQANDFACGLYGGKSERENRRWAEATAVANSLGVTSPAYRMAGFAADAAWMIRRAAHRDPNQRLAALLREICGNPFRPTPLNPAWLTPDVRALAEGIYQGGAFDRMPILGDALEDAGCTDGDILEHCRDPGPHVRGCWVVDLLLGKA